MREKLVMILSVILLITSIGYYYKQKNNSANEVLTNNIEKKLTIKTQSSIHNFPIYLEEEFFDTHTTTDTVCNCDIEVNGNNFKKSFYIKINSNYIAARNTNDNKIDKLFEQTSSKYCDYICDEFVNKVKDI